VVIYVKTALAVNGLHCVVERAAAKSTRGNHFFHPAGHSGAPAVHARAKIRAIMTFRRVLWAAIGLLFLTSSTSAADSVRLPTGVRLDPVGERVDLGNMPLSMALAPGGDRLIVSLGGWREQGLQVVDLQTRTVTQTLSQSAAFVGLAFSRDGHTLYASGGNDDAIYCYGWDGTMATLQRTIKLGEKTEGKPGTRFPAGLALSADGRFLYVAENLANQVAVIDLATSTVVHRVQTATLPYSIVVAGDGRVFVSAWGAETVHVFRAAAVGTDGATRATGELIEGGRIAVGRHPSALVLNAAGTRLFVASATTDRVAIVDTARLRVLRTLRTSAPGAPAEGTTPNALALPPDGARLFVAEADTNAVSVFELSASSAGTNRRQARDRLLGRIPTDWYPTGVMEHNGELLVLTGKGQGTGPNPKGPTPNRREEKPTEYTLGQTNGSLRIVPASTWNVNAAARRALSDRVATANGWTQPRPAPLYPPFKHVLYIIKENRTYDQLLGDMSGGDGDASLVFFGREVTPNHHALAERFGLFDRFFVNAEVSSQGHMWSTAAYVTDYGEKTIPSLYSDRRGGEEEEDADQPATGYLWDLARKKGIGFRDYGEWVVRPGEKHAIAAFDRDISKTYPKYDIAVPDQKRADVWIDELKGFVAKESMPALQIMHLPADHTAGGRAGLCTPRACLADNDLALGRIVEALSQSPFWRDTVIFVVEDDAQAGADHVDSHRAPFLAISAYSWRGTNHRFMNTTDVVGAIEDILHLGRLSQFDHYSRPLADLFTTTPDLTPYAAQPARISIDEKNPDKTKAADRSAAIDLSAPDRVDDALFNEILWEMLKGDRPQPLAARRSPIQLRHLTR
jgi:YVTN family beta-propeller protein